MKKTLRNRLVKWFSSRPNEVFSGGQMERMVSAVTTYKPSTISRRLREICEDGLLVATYEKGTVFYQWRDKETFFSKVDKAAEVYWKDKQHQQEHAETIERFSGTPLAAQLKSAREQTEMAKVQLTLV